MRIRQQHEKVLLVLADFSTSTFPSLTSKICTIVVQNLEAQAHYIYHKRKMAEVEFHHARFNNGSLETRTFSFSDGKEYTSPQAEANMTINSINANWLFALREQGFGQGTTLYLTFGAGLHDYSSKVSGLIFAGQTPSGAGAPPDPTILLEPINDTRTAFSASFGGGVQIGMGDKAALDVRVRYNIVMGELRPLPCLGH